MITPLLVFLLLYVGAKVEANLIYWILLIFFAIVGLYKDFNQ